MTRRLLVLLLLAFFMASPAHAILLFTGSYVGNGTDNTDIAVTGCTTPVAVFVTRNTSTRDMFTRFASHGANQSSIVTSTGVAVTDAIKSFGTESFRVGTNVNVNNSGSTMLYVAICDNGQNDVATLTWTGDASDNEDQTFTPTFTPEFALVIPTSTSTVRAWRGATSHSGDSASIISSSSADAANHIQAFGNGTIQVGTTLNVNTTVYVALVIKASAGALTGSFAGNTSDDRDITAIANPKFVGIKGNSTTAQLAYRHTAMDALNAVCDVTPQATNIIQAFTASGFQVGTNSCANENGVTMRWFAFGDFTEPSATHFFGRR